MSRAPLRYHQPFHTAVRVIMALGAAIPLWGAYDLLIAHGMPLLRWGMAPFVVMGLLALGFGALLLAFAVFGGSRTVTIDRRSRLCYVDFEGSFGIRRRTSHPFSVLRTPYAVEQPNSDGPSRWAVELPGLRKPLLVETYPDEAKARVEAANIAAYMAGA